MEVYAPDHCYLAPGMEAPHLIVVVGREPLDLFVKGQRNGAAFFVCGAIKMRKVETHDTIGALYANKLAIKPNVALSDRTEGQSACVCDFLGCRPGFLYAFDRMNGKHRTRMLQR